MSDIVEQLQIDAEEIACHGGDKVAIAKCIAQAADRIEELENQISQGFQNLRGRDVADCLIENAELRERITACEPYLKDGETPAECIQRNRDDAGAVLKLLAKEKRKHEALRGGLHKLMGDSRSYLDLVSEKQLYAVDVRDISALLEDDDD